MTSTTSASPGAARCCVIAVRNLRIATRQRDRGENSGYRGQEYAFEDARISLVDERECQSIRATSAVELVASTGTGAFEYFARWPAVRPRPPPPLPPLPPLPPPFPLRRFFFFFSF